MIQKDKEAEIRFKALRRELEAEIEADLAGAGLKPAATADSEGTTQAKGLSPKRILEALLFASARPLTMKEIQRIVGADPRLRPLRVVGPEGVRPDHDTNETRPGPTPRSAPPAKEIKDLISELQEEYQREGRSFELIEIAGGYEIVTRKEYAPWLARLELQRRIRQASRSALETLAILAYKQPVTRAEIEVLRGVDISGVLSTLLEKGFVKMVGRKEVPGRPFLYGTTEKFLEHFGLKSLQDLPQIGEIKSWVERAVRREELRGEDPP